jgi:hypothetical protein
VNPSTNVCCCTYLTLCSPPGCCKQGLRYPSFIASEGAIFYFFYFPMPGGFWKHFPVCCTTNGWRARGKISLKSAFEKILRSKSDGLNSKLPSEYCCITVPKLYKKTTIRILLCNRSDILIVNCHQSIAVAHFQHLIVTCHQGIAVLQFQHFIVNCHQSIAVLQFQHLKVNCHQSIAVLQFQHYTVNCHQSIALKQFWHINSKLPSKYCCITVPTLHSKLLSKYCCITVPTLNS